MKKVILLTILCLCFILVSCGESGASTEPTPTQDNNPTAVPEEQLSPEGKIKKDKETLKTVESIVSIGLADANLNYDEFDETDTMFIYITSDGVSTDGKYSENVAKAMNEVSELTQYPKKLLSENAVGHGITCIIKPSKNYIETYCDSDEDIKVTNEGEY